MNSIEEAMTDAIADGMDARSASKDHQCSLGHLRNPHSSMVWFLSIVLMILEIEIPINPP